MAFAMGVRYHFGFRVGQGVVNTRFSGDPNVGRLYGTSLPTFGWFRYPSVGESSVRRLIAAAALAAAASGWNFDQHLDSKGSGAGLPRNLGWVIGT